MKTYKNVIVLKCARCGKDHNVHFKPFIVPMSEWTHWGTCPNTKEPIMMRIVEDE